MKVLVTGATGFLGTHLCREMRNRDMEVTALSSKEADLRTANSLDLFSTSKFDFIYHLAAWTQAGDFCLSHPGEQWIINQEINTTVLSWWQRSQPQAKLVAIGSSCCYEPGTPHSEENFLKGVPTESLLTYAMTKRMLYQGLRALHQQFGLRYLFLVPSTLYGPDYHVDGRQMHFIFDLVRKLVHAKEAGEKATLWGDGTQVRELIHVTDFVKIGLELAAKVNNDIINIGEGRGHTIRQFAELICHEINLSADTVDFDTSRYVGAQDKVLVINKLNSILANSPRIPLERGISEIISWYKENAHFFKRSCHDKADSRTR